MDFVVWWTVVAAVTTSSSATRFRQGTSKNNVDFRLRLDNFDSVQYSAAFSLGDQTLPVIYDTGSFEIIVLSTLCASCSQAHAAYNSSKSTSFVADNGVTAEHIFGSGPVQSQKGFEMVRLGGRDSPYSASHRPFWQVTSHDIEVWDHTAHFSGIVGLGHPGHTPEGFSPENSEEADSMLVAMQISSFAFCLERGPAAPGWLAVGPTVEALPRSSSSFEALEVVGQVHWGVKMMDFQIPNVVVGNPCVPSCGVILDSGTSLIAVPPAAVHIVTALSQLIHRDCSNLHTLPILQINLDGKMIELPPAAYVMQTRTRTSNSSLLRRLFGTSEYETVNECSAGFMTIDKDSQFGPVWILGMPFLRYYFTVFDRVSKTVHIARSTPSCTIASRSLGFFNTTSLEGVRGPLGTGGFTMSDYQPTPVDLNAVRIPAWANTHKKHVSF